MKCIHLARIQRVITLKLDQIVSLSVSFCVFSHSFFWPLVFRFDYRRTEFFRKKKNHPKNIDDDDPPIKLIATQTARLAYEMGQKYLFVLCSHSFPFLWMSKFIITYLKTVKQISQLNRHIVNSFVSYLKLYFTVGSLVSFRFLNFRAVFPPSYSIFSLSVYSMYSQLFVAIDFVAIQNVSLLFCGKIGFRAEMNIVDGNLNMFFVTNTQNASNNIGAHAMKW